MSVEEIMQAYGVTKEVAEKIFAANKKVDETNAAKLLKVQKQLEKAQEEKKTSDLDGSTAKEKLEAIVDVLGIDIDAEDFDSAVDDWKANIIKEAGGGVTPEEVRKQAQELKKLQRDYKKLQDENTTTNATLTEERTKRQTSIKRSTLLAKLNEHNVMKADQMVDLFMGKAVVGDDDSIIIKGSDGVELTVEDAIADWAKGNPEFISAKQKGGAGSGTGGSGDGSGVNPIVAGLIADKKAESDKGSEAVINKFFGN